MPPGDLITNSNIKSRILNLRGVQVMLDSHLAELYQIETKVLNQSVKRNAQRFPISFMFQLNEKEWKNLKSQFVTSSFEHGGARKLPFAFTEQGVAMLSAVLKSEVAIRVSIQIMNAFVEMRQALTNFSSLIGRVEKVEHKQAVADENFEKIFMALEHNDQLPQQGIFFNGQIFDAYKFVLDIIRKAKFSIVLIDNYIDDATLQLFSKRKNGVNVIVYTKKITSQLQLDLDKFNKQYGVVEIRKLDSNHDRFLIIDQKEMYHIGASLKDLGSKIFGFSKMDTEVFNLLAKIGIEL